MRDVGTAKPLGGDATEAASGVVNLEPSIWRHREGSEILAYYERYDEEGRLARGEGLLQYARMRELIQRFLSSPPGVVLDVGGGPGRYSFWLAEIGYQVHLIDPVEKHVWQAREASESQLDHPLASVTRGDARSLNHGDASVDAVLLMGPLYHLTDRDDRLTALREAHRVLKPSGVLIAKAISRFASLLDGLTEGFIDDPAYDSILSRDFEDGQHRGHAHDYFTTAFFHRPEELEAEVHEAGFVQEGVYSVQGPGQLATDLEESAAARPNSLRGAGDDRWQSLLPPLAEIGLRPDSHPSDHSDWVFGHNRPQRSYLGEDWAGDV